MFEFTITVCFVLNNKFIWFNYSQEEFEFIVFIPQNGCYSTLTVTVKDKKCNANVVFRKQDN